MQIKSKTMSYAKQKAKTKRNIQSNLATELNTLYAVDQPNEEQKERIEYLEYKLKRCSKKECCKQCRYVKFKRTMPKWPAQKLTHRTTQKHAEHHDATDIYKKPFLCFSHF